MKPRIKPLGRYTALALLLGCAVALPAAAQDGPELLRLADGDGDGAISQAEARAAAQQQFAQLDRNHDGQISEAEFVESRVARFNTADGDGDGKLTRAELRAQLMSRRQR